MIKNQFILTNINYNQNELKKNKVNFGSYAFYYHNNISIVITENDTVKILVAGCLFDHENIFWDNSDIVNSWFKDNKIDFLAILKKTYKYSGNFLVFYFNKSNDNLKIFNDAAGQYELYYTINGHGATIASSNHKLISELTPLIEDKKPETIEFFKSEAFKLKKAFILEDTNYINLKRLIPNHYLDVNQGKSIRFFPNEKVKKTTLNEASLKGSKMIKGFLHAAAYRKKLLIPVTSGWDSRLLLAASKEISDKVVYHLFFNKRENPLYDKNIPIKLFNKLNLPFIIVYNNIISNQDISKKVKDYTLFPTCSVYRNIKNFYSKFPGFLGLNGNISEIVRLEFDEIMNLNPRKIAFIEKYPFLDYSLKRYSNWFEKNNDLFKKYGYRSLDMLYWEENCGSWISKQKSESRLMGVEIYSPFNSREFLLTIYGLPKKYRKKQNPIIYYKMIKKLWPEVMAYPVNPGLKKIAIRITQCLGIFAIFRNLKLHYNLFKGRNKW